MNKFNFNKITPFKWFILENFPFIEANFDALTEWQLFCKIIIICNITTVS